MFMVTYSGRRVDPFALNVDDIRIEDIAHSLSLLCRFGGHTAEFYSVAQHSVRVALSLPRNLRLEGLLHDATEAYIQDLVRPIKRRMDGYKNLEKDVWSIIAFKYGFNVDGLSAEVIDADNRCLKSEISQFVTGGAELVNCEPWTEIEALPATQYPWSPGEAEGMFMSFFIQFLSIKMGTSSKVVNH